MLFRKRRSTHRTHSATKNFALWKQLLYGFIVIVVVFLLGYGLWYVTRLPSLTISEIIVEGGETVSHEEVEAIVEDELAGSYVFLVPHRFTYTYPYKEIIASLNTISKLSNIAVEKVNNTTLRVAFDEYAPRSLWCFGTQENDPCIFLDPSGYAFSYAPPLKGGVFVRYVTEGKNPEIRTYISEKDTLESIERLIEVLDSELGFRVGTVVLIDETDANLLLHRGGTLKISLEVGVKEIFENLQSILQSEKFSHIKPGNFNYIDLRFGNRVFINEELETPETDGQDSDTATTTTTTTTSTSTVEIGLE